MEVKIGLRVVRGRDWERGNEDGGEGYVGTVVAGGRAEGAEEERHDVATVQWDVGGERQVYRCGARGKYDLRVMDSAPAGEGCGLEEGGRKNVCFVGRCGSQALGVQWLWV